MKKKQDTQYLQGIADMIQGVESSPFLLVGIEILHDHSVGLNAFGCSISRPDMSQSNVSAKYCYAAHESRLHQNDRCKRFALCLVLTVRFRSLAPWGKLFQLFI